MFACVFNRYKMSDHTSSALLDSLRQLLGASHVLTDGDLSCYEQDWRKRSRGKALAVVRPANTEEVVAVVKACANARVSIVPQGGNTGLVVGSIPNESGTQVVLSMQRMQRVRNVDADNLTITVEAGCTLQSVQDAAEKAGYLFPLSLGSEGSCTIGGNLGTNAGGTQVVRYGNARELCLGLEVVTASGEVMHGLSGLRKDNTGYDLRNLMIGSEGTLGIITAATMKLFPQPAATLTAWAAVPTVTDAVKLLGLAHQHLGASLTGFEMMNQFSLGLVNKHFPQMRIPLWNDTPYCVLLENSDTESQEHDCALQTPKTKSNQCNRYGSPIAISLFVWTSTSNHQSTPRFLDGLRFLASFHLSKSPLERHSPQKVWPRFCMRCVILSSMPST